MTPQRIQLKRTKGWRKPEGVIVVSRPTKWGNPFRVGERTEVWHRAGGWPFDLYWDSFKVVRAEQAIGLYRKLLVDKDHFQIRLPVVSIEEIRAELQGHDLACWCALDRACHADVLLELANKEGE